MVVIFFVASFLISELDSFFSIFFVLSGFFFCKEGFGAGKSFTELVVNRQGEEQDVGLCVGAVYPFANYQIDLFVLQGFDSIENHQVGVGFSWQIK